MNVFVAFFVLLLLLAESTPKAAESVPLIGIYKLRIKKKKKIEHFKTNFTASMKIKKKIKQQPSNVFAYYRNLLLSEHDNDYTFYNFGCHRNKHVLPRCSN